jgi:hypothetical protein
MAQQSFGMGIRVTENRPSHSLSSLILLMSEPKADGASLSLSPCCA